MGESISGYLTRLDQEKLEKAKRSRGKEKRITIIFSEFDSRRLKYISRQFSSQPSVFARELLIQALNDAEKFLGLNEIDEDEEYTDSETGEVTYFQSEYGSYINSTGPDILEDEEVSDETKANRNSIAHNNSSK